MRLTRPICVVLMLILISGCAHARNCLHTTPPQPPSQQLDDYGNVQVIPIALSGQGNESPNGGQLLPIPSTGLPLRTAIEAVVGPLEALVAIRHSNLSAWHNLPIRPDYVQLIRNGEYLNLQIELVESTILGTLPLQNHDIVLLSPVEDVVTTAEYAKNLVAQVEGHFRISGPFSPRNDVVAFGKNRRLIATLETDQLFPGVKMGCNSLVITRIEGGITHRSLIPYVRRHDRAVAGSIDDPYWGKFEQDTAHAWIYTENAYIPIREGDNIEFTTLELLPELLQPAVPPVEQQSSSPPADAPKKCFPFFPRDKHRSATTPANNPGTGSLDVPCRCLP